MEPHLEDGARGRHALNSSSPRDPTHPSLPNEVHVWEAVAAACCNRSGRFDLKCGMLAVGSMCTLVLDGGQGRCHQCNRSPA